MIDVLNKEITKIREKIRIREKLNQRLNSLETELEEEEEKLKKLKIELEKEEQDVASLEGKTLNSLIQTLLGKKQEKLEIEKEEYIVAKIKYDECLNKINTLVIQKNKIKLKLEDYKNVDIIYSNLLIDKEYEIMHSNKAENITLGKIIDKISNTNLDIKEISEAYSAGNKLLMAIYDTINSLQKAKDWGTWDILGGDVISTLIKHDYIDEAKKNSYKVKECISSFKMELSDININLNIDINLDSFTVFADFFFDGVFVDWYVQTNINNALYNARELKQNVIVILQNLDNKKKISEEKLGRLKEEYMQIIDKY
jgi:DNA repair exonuclease SbcCD ATPase subunit